MEIRILGPLEVVAAGDPVDLSSGKARLLLAALVVHANQVVSTDRLFEFLWRGQPTAPPTPCRPTSRICDAAWSLSVGRARGASW